MNKFDRMLEKFLKESNKKHKDILNRLDRKNKAKKKPLKKESNGGK
ncbi:hypothetical protein [Desulforamulus aeronauticus]|nr:hypothetical protein [Desulforamulus aeronauticus]